MSDQVDIVIADDHPLLLEGIVGVVQKQYPDFVIHKAQNGAVALQLIAEKSPELAILDIEMPLLDGIEVVKKLRAAQDNTKIVFLTLHKEQTYFNEVQALKISGYVLKEFSILEIKDCIAQVLAGQTYYSKSIRSLLDSSGGLPDFTKAERNVLKLIAQGKTSKEIAAMLFVSVKTIDSHRYNIAKKLNLPPEKNSLMKWVLQNSSKIKG